MLKALTIYDRREMLCVALRSGKYEQGYGAYATQCEVAPCVLGVARLIGLLEGDLDTIYADVPEKLGFASSQLWEKNDNGMPFTKIADWIEKQP